MDDGVRLWFGIIVTVLILLITFFLTLCESEIDKLGDFQINKLAENDKRGRLLKKLYESDEDYAIGNFSSRIVIVLALSVVSVLCFCQPLIRHIFDSFELSGTMGLVLKTAVYVIILFLAAVLVCAFGIIIPRLISKSDKYDEKFVLKAVRPYSLLIRLNAPVYKLSKLISALLCRAFGIKDDFSNEPVTEEDILTMVNEPGGIEQSQAEMINNIFEFDDLKAHEVMTHRVDIAAVEINESIKTAVSVALDKGVSRIPVYKNNIDDICGVVYAKDLLNLILKDNPEQMHLKDFMRDIKFVPESKSCVELFNMFTAEKIHIAVVVDDYGGTAGIVTMEDLLETIVGSIQDEYDHEDEPVKKISENTFEILGNADIDDAMDALGKSLPEDNDYETMSGFVTDLLGYIPDDGEKPSVKWENVTFSVLEAEDNHINKLKAVVSDDKAEDKL
ncbi:MAG: hemolysin family protein [Oscillospiraceae bacterium]